MKDLFNYALIAANFGFWVNDFNAAVYMFGILIVLDIKYFSNQIK